jgi:S-adenosylmethionine:tRNA ribosyltransferase-isomerase
MRKHSDPYSYSLPKELIALEPAKERTESKLFVYDTATGAIVHSHFSKIQEFLPKKYTLVLNETTVSPARITLYKKSGGKITALFLVNEIINEGTIRVMVDRKVAIHESLFVEGMKKIGVVTRHSENGIFVLELSVTKNKLYEILEESGSMPIPLYLRDTHVSKDELFDRYQTVFAPTASLHFSAQLLENMKQNGATIAPIVLHVGLGTFAPLTPEAVKKGTLHHEWYTIPHTTLQQLQNKPIVAVGTTAVRALEAFAKTKNLNGSTNLFIRPPYNFSFVDTLVTNFHLPQSSLMMLVEAFLQYKKAKHHVVALYESAIKERYRFYSFGDAMLITSSVE